MMIAQGIDFIRVGFWQLFRVLLSTGATVLFGLGRLYSYLWRRCNRGLSFITETRSKKKNRDGINQPANARSARTVIGLRGLGLFCVVLLLAACAGNQTAPYRVMTSQYKVRHGDSLEAIAWRYGLNYQEVAAWNRLKPPYRLVPGQRIALNPPVGYKPQRTAVVSRPSRSPPRRSAEAVPKPLGHDISVAPAVAAPPAELISEEEWLWPAKGKVVRYFSDGNRGIDIQGEYGAPVVAVAQGKVVYSGDALKGYGQLIIIKHTEALLSAYAHNRLRLVSRGMLVNRGQKIAEIGRANQGQPLLHFEIRDQGTPIDPLGFLPQ